MSGEPEQIGRAPTATPGSVLAMSDPTKVPADAGGTPEPAGPRTSQEILHGHMPELDGLRGLAIILVVLGHAFLLHPPSALRLFTDATFLAPLRATWIGVDLFFVLSGFLISGILLDSRGRKGYFREYYARRVLRIFPLYYGFLLVYFFLLPLISRRMGPSAFVLEHQSWYWGCIQNWLVVFADSRARIGGPVIHFWSLGVEEQFYLFWPIIIACVSRQGLVVLCGLLIAGSFALRGVLIAQEWSADSIYVMTFTRMDMLAWGALMAALARGSKGLAGIVVPARIAMIAGAAGVAISFAIGRTFDHHGPHVQFYGFTAMGLLGAGLIITLITLPANSAAAIAFRNPVLAFVGRRSYAIYVLHVAIALWARTNITRNVAAFTGSAAIGVLSAATVTFILSVAAATLTARFLEEPFLRLRKYFAVRREPGEGVPAAPAQGK